MSKKVVEKVVEPKPLPPKRKCMFCKNNVLEKQVIHEEPTETTELCGCIVDNT